jgi:hypothetical protein
MSERFLEKRSTFFGIYAVVIIGALVILGIPEADAYKTAITGFFEGTSVENTIATVGNYQINNEKSKLVLTGEIQELLTDNKLGGCKNIRADFIIIGEDTNIEIDFTGKKCLYGQITYGMGYIESSDSTLKGRMTFMIDQRTDNVSGHLFGSIRVS